MERFVKLVSPNGVEAEVREDAVDRLVRAGWTRADGRRQRTTRRRTTKDKQ